MKVHCNPVHSSGFVAVKATGEFWKAALGRMEMHGFARIQIFFRVLEPNDTEGDNGHGDSSDGRGHVAYDGFEVGEELCRPRRQVRRFLRTPQFCSVVPLPSLLLGPHGLDFRPGLRLPLVHQFFPLSFEGGARLPSGTPPLAAVVRGFGRVRGIMPVTILLSGTVSVLTSMTTLFAPAALVTPVIVAMAIVINALFPPRPLTPSPRSVPIWRSGEAPAPGRAGPALRASDDALLSFVSADSGGREQLGPFRWAQVHGNFVDFIMAVFGRIIATEKRRGDG
mmetsp:Transcript_21648/g.63573  ORF Transcript_21648/g.63573 Transcript_21648/m.63573 type:complete len:281 (-) Transcript_21648:1296-2138(-)